MSRTSLTRFMSLRALRVIFTVGLFHLLWSGVFATTDWWLTSYHMWEPLVLSKRVSETLLYLFLALYLWYQQRRSPVDSVIMVLLLLLTVQGIHILLGVLSH